VFHQEDIAGELTTFTSTISEFMDRKLVLQHFRGLLLGSRGRLFELQIGNFTLFETEKS
jgi:hypothetical protein